MKLFGCLLAFAWVLSSCYKEDAQILYSRQYVIPELTTLRDELNKRLDELQDGLTKVINAEPINNLEYVVENGDTVGVRITIGTTKIFLPYGKNGKNADPYVVTMGENGNWFINNEDTGNPWRGVDGLTPIFGIKQEPDKNFYWTIAWPGKDGEEFMKDADGNKVRANGLPGVDSPLRDVGENDTAFVFTIQHPGQDTLRYFVPKPKDLGFYIYPEVATLNGTTLSDRWNPDTRVLTFNPGEEIGIPYKKSDELDQVVSNLPMGWTARVAEAEKKVYIKAPDYIALMDSPYSGPLTLVTKTKNGLSYQRELTLQSPKNFYVDFFFTDRYERPTAPATSPLNEVRLFPSGKYSHFFGLYENLNNTYQSRVRTLVNQNSSAADMEQRLKQTPYLSLAKPKDYASYAMPSLIYHSDSLTLSYYGDIESEPTKLYLERKGQEYNAISYSGRSVFVKPVPRDTYGAFEVITNTGAYSYYRTIRLRSLTQEIRLFMVDPHKWLGLDAAEEFVPNNLVLYHRTTYGRTVQDDQYGSVITVSGKNRNLMTKAERLGTYDPATKLYKASFYQFPCNQVSDYQLYLEYTNAAGVIIRRVVETGTQGIPNIGLRFAPRGGTQLSYYLGYEVAYENTYTMSTSLGVLDENGVLGGYYINPNLRLPYDNPNNTSYFERDCL